LNNSFGIWKQSWRLWGSKIIPVGHDAGGPTAVHFALKHPERADAIA
jgi:pimeloyl-ACP methyl ester carboxylesterase